MKRFFANLKQAYDRWQRDDGSLMAAAVAYYASLSLFPLLLILIAGVGMFLSFSRMGQDAEQQVLGVIADHVSPALERQIAEALQQIQSTAPVNGPLGIATLLLTAIAMFVQFDRAFDRIWNIEQQERGLLAAIKEVLLNRLIAFLALLCLGALVIAIFVGGMILDALRTYSEQYVALPNWSWSLAQTTITLLLNAGLFAVIYRVVPKVPVSWKGALQGAAVAAVGWEIGRQVLARFLIGSKYASAYGVVGSFLSIMLWCYYAAAILFLGAEYVQVICKRSDPPSIAGGGDAADPGDRTD